MGLFKKIAKAVLPAAGAFFGAKIPGIGSGIGQALGTGVAGAIGSGGGGWDAEDSFEANAALQREFAQHGIRWRVEDARAAGVHPLFALGAGGAAAAPVSVMDSPREDWSGRMGQDLGRAVTAQMDTNQRRLQEAQITVLESEAAKNNALALAALGSRSATSNQPGSQVPFPYVHEGPVDMTGFMNQSVMKPVEFFSSSSTPGIAAGPGAPGMFVYNFGGSPILLPGAEVDQALEALAESPLLMGMVYKMNVNHFGPEHMENFVRRNVPFGEDYYTLRDMFREGADIVSGRPSFAERVDRDRRTVRGRIRPSRSYPTPWGPYRGFE